MRNPKISKSVQTESKIVLLRANSKGIEATYANAEHHASPCIPLIKILEATILSLSEKYIITWRQGNNVHEVIREDGTSIIFRPFLGSEISGGVRTWGIDVSMKTPDKSEVVLFSIAEIAEANVIGVFLEMFLHRVQYQNKYGAAGVKPVSVEEK